MPKAPPESVTARFRPKGPGQDIASWLLVVEGRNGLAQPYRTELLVFRDHEGHLKAINVVWWSGNGVGEATPLDPPP